MKHDAYRGVDLSFFRTEFQFDEFHYFLGESDQFLSIQNRVFVAPQECCLEDCLKAVCGEFGAFFLVPPNGLVEFFPVIPWSQLQETNQPKGIGERVDDWRAEKSQISRGKKSGSHKSYPVKHQRYVASRSTTALDTPRNG